MDKDILRFFYKELLEAATDAGFRPDCADFERRYFWTHRKIDLPDGGYSIELLAKVSLEEDLVEVKNSFRFRVVFPIADPDVLKKVIAYLRGLSDELWGPE